MTSWAFSISFGFVLEVSALKSTVTPLSLTAAHRGLRCATFYHFCPHLTPNRFSVNRKLVGRAPAVCLILKSSTNCGLLLGRPQVIVFLALVRLPLSPIRRVAEPVEKLLETQWQIVLWATARLL